MPVVIGIAVFAGAAFLLGKAAEEVGEGVDQVGSGALKLAVAGALGAGAWLAFKRFA